MGILIFGETGSSSRFFVTKLLLVLLTEPDVRPRHLGMMLMSLDVIDY
jgi:hypothetical protein